MTLEQEVKETACSLSVEEDLEEALKSKKIRFYRVFLGKRRFEVYARDKEIYVVPITGGDPTVNELREIMKMVKGVGR